MLISNREEACLIRQTVRPDPIPIPPFLKKHLHVKSFSSMLDSHKPSSGVCMQKFNQYLATCTLILSALSSSCNASEQIENGKERLRQIHQRIALLHGDLEYEYPEQLMSAIFLPSDAKVLELGSDLGRNTHVIAAILDDSSNLVTLETRSECIPYLIDNRNYNGFHFHIECAALSKHPLIQLGWNTIQSDVDLPGYRRINTVSFAGLQQKYGITFDTLVADCEGGLYYALQDEPEALTNIKLVIMENDYATEEQYIFVTDLFKAYGLELVYNEGYIRFSGNNAFYQVWKK